MPTQHRRPAPLALALASLLISSACAVQPDSGTPQPAASSPAARDVQPSTTVAPRPELATLIHAAGYDGVFVLLDPASEQLIVSDPEFAERRFIPASTFKIPNSLIALETGVADSPELTLEWDGVERRFAAWNRDHDMRSAFAVSAVWYYQTIARRIGEQRMAQWVVAADYGNADIAGGVDMFWLNGGLRISPREQVEFLRRLHEHHSPFSPAVVATFLDQVMVAEQRDAQRIIRAKTGWARAQDFSDPSTAGFDGHAGWYVGSLEQVEGARVYFATLLLAPEPAPASFVSDRRRLTTLLLSELGYLVPS